MCVTGRRKLFVNSTDYSRSECYYSTTVDNVMLCNEDKFFIVDSEEYSVKILIIKG